LERRIAIDLAADVTDDAAEPGAQELQRAPGALELMRMGAATRSRSRVDSAPVRCATERLS
jgi:hypothetical protein